MVNICSRFFLQLHDLCEKYKSNPNSKPANTKKRSPPREIHEDSGSDSEETPLKPTKVKRKMYDPLKEDPNAPKKPIIQAYLLYYTEVRAERQKEHPELKNVELTKIIAKEWNDLSKERKMVSPYAIDNSSVIKSRPLTIKRNMTWSLKHI